MEKGDRSIENLFWLIRWISVVIQS